MYSLIFYVPNTHLETVKEAVFTAGAGTIGDYQFCAKCPVLLVRGWIARKA